MGVVSLTGIDLNDPTPGVKREIAPNRGSAGGATRSRDIVILANKVASVGSGSVDGLGSDLNTPILIGGGEDEVIQRFGYHSEALLLYKVAVRHNKQSQIFICCIPPGTGSGTFTWTFVNAATANTVLVIDVFGEPVEVAIANGDAIGTIATNVAAAINAQLHWVLAASPALGVVTVTSTIAGTRHDHYLNKARAYFKKSATTTVTKSAVTPGSSDDDQTNAILALENFDIYYQVNPKAVTSGVTSTDNGIGEHLAAMVDWVAPTKGKQCVLITGQVGTPTQGTTVAISMNQWFAFHVHAEASDWSPGMIATMFAAILAKGEASDRAVNLANYGVKSSSDTIYIPDPYTKTDRATSTEIKTLLNNGVTPIGFTSNGKPYIVWYVTTKSQTNSVSDYRARPGHIPSICFDFWETLAIEYNSVAQPKVADDPKDGEKPIPGFTYPKDIRALQSRCIDLKCGDGGPATLDPGQRQAMKDAIYVERLVSGTAARGALAAVRHNLKAHFLLEEVSPSI